VERSARAKRAESVLKTNNILPPRFKMLHGNLLDKLRNTPEWFDVRQMATITHSLGKMTIADHDFFTEVSGRSRASLDEDENASRATTKLTLFHY